VVFAMNREGKTTFVSHIIANCINNKVKVFLYSGEMSTDKIQNWVYRQMTGSNEEYLRIVKTKYRDKVEPKEYIIKLIKNFHRETFYLYDRDEAEITGNLDKFFEILEIAAKRYGVQLFVIDNLMAVLEENGDTLYSDQANFIQRCKNFSIKNKIHVILVAHPNKEKREIEGISGNLQKTDISGSNNIANKADNIIAVERIWNENDDEPDCIVTSLKDRQNGQRKVMKFYFSNETLRFYNDTTKEKIQYNWEKEFDNDLDIVLEETDDSVPWK